MAKKYEVDGKYFLPVTVFTTDARSINPIGVQYVFASNGNKGTTYLDDYPDLLLTAEEIYASRQTADKIEYLTDMLDYGRKKYDEIEELKSRNAELEALLKEVMATRDEAIKQNNELIADRNNWKEAAQRYHDNAKVADAAADELRKENRELKAKVTELIAENKKLKSDCNEWKDTADDRIVDVQNLTAERDNLKADLATQKEVNEELKAKIAELTAWYEEANRTASEAAEANDDLKAKIAELRDEVATLKAERCSLNGQVGKNLAEIQDLNAEIHFLKAERDKFAKTAKDKADLANKACDERNDEHGDLVTAKAAIDYLQEENKKLKQELKDAEASYNVVAETSIKRKNRITTMEEVIVALVEKIRRLESDD